jgi:OFA family oxalate/formate antiporter-like MFS transporter
MLTAWGCASAVGPVMIAHVRQSTGKYGDALLILATVMAGAAVLPLFLRAPVRVGETEPPLHAKAMAPLRPMDSSA